MYDLDHLVVSFTLMFYFVVFKPVCHEALRRQIGAIIVATVLKLLHAGIHMGRLKNGFFSYEGGEEG